MRAFDSCPTCGSTSGRLHSDGESSPSSVRSKDFARGSIFGIYAWSSLHQPIKPITPSISRAHREGGQFVLHSPIVQPAYFLLTDIVGSMEAQRLTLLSMYRTRTICRHSFIHLLCTAYNDVNLDILVLRVSAIASFLITMRLGIAA